MNFFSKKPTVKEQVRSNEKVLRKGQRDIERDRRDIERQEKKLEMDIKQAAKKGDKQLCTVLAKQLVQMRKQKSRTYQMSSKMSGISNQQKMMASNMAMANSVGTATKTMENMNKIMDPQKMAQTMQDFERQNAKMEMTEEMISDTLDDIMNESGDEEESDAIVTQVLDEIGIEISGKMADAPRAPKERIGESASAQEDADLEAQLAKLKAL